MSLQAGPFVPPYCFKRYTLCSETTWQNIFLCKNDIYSYIAHSWPMLFTRVPHINGSFNSQTLVWEGMLSQSPFPVIPQLCLIKYMTEKDNLSTLLSFYGSTLLWSNLGIFMCFVNMGLHVPNLDLVDQGATEIFWLLHSKASNVKLRILYLNFIIHYSSVRISWSRDISGNKRQCFNVVGFFKKWIHLFRWAQV